jgi:hypothetical protein
VVEDGDFGFGRWAPCIVSQDERGASAGADAKGIGLGDAELAVVIAVISLLEGINFSHGDVGDEFCNVGVDACFNACADVEVLVFREVMQADSEAGFEA